MSPKITKLTTGSSAHLLRKCEWCWSTHHSVERVYKTDKPVGHGEFERHSDLQMIIAVAM